MNFTHNSTGGPEIDVRRGVPSGIVIARLRERIRSELRRVQATGTVGRDLNRLPLRPSVADLLAVPRTGAGRSEDRLERARLDLPCRRLRLVRPAGQCLARRREALLNERAAAMVKNGGLKDGLVNVDRGQHATSLASGTLKQRSSPAHRTTPLHHIPMGVSSGGGWRLMVDE
jgi:hypothetical protein